MRGGARALPRPASRPISSRKTCASTSTSEHALAGDRASHDLVFPHQFRHEMDGISKAAVGFLDKYRAVATDPALAAGFAPTWRASAPFSASASATRKRPSTPLPAGLLIPIRFQTDPLSTSPGRATALSSACLRVPIGKRLVWGGRPAHPFAFNPIRCDFVGRAAAPSSARHRVSMGKQIGIRPGRTGV